MLLMNLREPLSDQAVNACCSCERLLRKKSVTEAKNLDSDVWNNLLDYLRENNPVALNKVMYISIIVSQLLGKMKCQHVVCSMG